MADTTTNWSGVAVNFDSLQGNGGYDWYNINITVGGNSYRLLHGYMVAGLLEVQAAVEQVAGSASDASDAAEAAETSADAAAQSVIDAAGQVALATGQAALADAAKLAAQQAQTLAQNAAGGQAGVGIALLSKSLVTAADVVAVHVYDTTQDSDGGAWRLRCAHTSWAQEAPSATRGARREFPPVALIVVRPTSLTIHDALDLDTGTGVPRMWMVINAAVAGTIPSVSAVTSVACCEGRLYIGLATAGMVVVDFRADETYRYGSADGGYNWRPVARRHEAAGAVKLGPRAIVSDSVTSVHARVLPGAPLDHLGLPIPTVAVACGSSGASVVLPDGRVADIAGCTVTRVALSGDGRLMLLDPGAGPRVGPVPYADAAYGSWQVRLYQNGVAPATASGAIVTATMGDGLVVEGRTGGLALIAEGANPAAGIAAVITKEYATGWQAGDIRLAALCDGTTGNVTGSGELVANGTFATDTAGWAGINAALSVVSGRLRVASTVSSGNAVADYTVSVTAGQMYRISVDVVDGTASGNNSLHVTDGSPAAAVLINLSNSGSTSLEGQFTPSGSTVTVRLFCSVNSVGQYTDFDNVSVKLVTPDRSYKAKGLVVNGTLTRAAVATGSDLVWAKGFVGGGSPVYLEQPQTGDLNFGTGDLFVCAWVSSVANDWYMLIADYGTYSGGAYTGGGFWLGTLSSGRLSFIVREAGVATNVTSANNALPENAVSFVWARRRAGSGLIEIGINDRVVASVTGTLRNTTNAAAVLRIGAGHDGFGSTPTAGLALLRISGTAPSNAQIRRMYRDEAPLFEVGAKAFLGGTSSAVSSLARDAGRGLLTVGTGDGVSVISGLRRVAYLDGTGLPGTIASDTIAAVGAGAGYALIGTAANAGVYNAGVAYQDELAARPAPGGPALAWDGVTTDATPTTIGRVHVSEGESLSVEVTVQALDYAAAQTEGASYTLRCRVRRAPGGNVNLVGNAFKITIDETTATMDAALAVNTTTQTLDITVTGKAATTLRWRATGTVNRLEAI